MLKLYFDGACEPVNPGGTASYGWLVKNEAGKIILSGFEIIGSGNGMTNNVAEYSGLIAGLEKITEINKKERLEIFGDSSLVCNMVSKKWGYKKTKSGKIVGWLPHHEAPHLKILLDKVLSILNGREFSISWIPREENHEADALSKKALEVAGIRAAKN